MLRSRSDGLRIGLLIVCIFEDYAPRKLCVQLHSVYRTDSGSRKEYKTGKQENPFSLFRKSQHSFLFFLPEHCNPAKERILDQGIEERPGHPYACKQVDENAGKQRVAKAQHGP